MINGYSMSGLHERRLASMGYERIKIIHTTSDSRIQERHSRSSLWLWGLTAIPRGLKYAMFPFARASMSVLGTAAFARIS